LLLGRPPRCPSRTHRSHRLRHQARTAGHRDVPAPIETQNPPSLRHRGTRLELPRLARWKFDCLRSSEQHCAVRAFALVENEGKHAIAARCALSVMVRRAPLQAGPG